MMRKIINLICLFLCLFYLGQKVGYEDQKAIADDFREKKQYKEALKIYDELLTKDSKNYELLGDSGICLYGLQNYNKAKERFLLAALYCPVDKKSTISNFYTNLSSCYASLNNREKSYDYSIKAYKIDPYQDLNLWNAVSSANNFGKYDEGLDMLDNAKIEKEDTFLALYGVLYFRKEEYEKSIISYEKFFKLYNKETALVNPNILWEKSNLFFSYMNFINSVLEPNFFNEHKERISELLNDLTQSEEYRKEIFDIIFGESNYWFSSKESRDLLSNFYKKNSSQLSVSEKIKFNYKNKDFKECYALSDNFLKENKEYDVQTRKDLKTYYYLSSLNLLLDDFIANDQKVNKEKLDSILSLYLDFFEKNHEYTEAELNDREDIAYLVSETMESYQNFEMKYKKKIVPVIVKIIMNTPNRRFIEEMKKNENKLTSINYQ